MVSDGTSDLTLLQAENATEFERVDGSEELIENQTTAVEQSESQAAEVHHGVAGYHVSWYTPGELGLSHSSSTESSSHQEFRGRPEREYHIPSLDPCCFLDEDSTSSADCQKSIMPSLDLSTSSDDCQKLIHPASDAAHGDQEALVSVGSVGHADGLCQPCRFVHCKVGCRRGSSCTFCHLPHKRENKPRPCKGQRDRYRKLLNRLEALIETEPLACSQSMASLPPAMNCHSTHKARLVAKLELKLAEIGGMPDVVFPAQEDSIPEMPDQAGVPNSSTLFASSSSTILHL